MTSLAVNCLENLLSTLVQQRFGNLHTQRLGFGGRRTTFGAQQHGAIRLADQSAQPQLFAFKHRVTGDRHLAATVQALVQGTLGDNPGRGRRVVQAFQQRMQFAVGGTALDTDRALTAGRQTLIDANAGADALAEAKADQPRSSEDDGVVLASIELGQSGVDVAAQELDFQVRPARQQLAWRRSDEVPTTLPGGSASRSSK